MLDGSSSFDRNSDFESRCVRDIVAHFASEIAPQRPGLTLNLVQGAASGRRKDGLAREMQHKMGDAILCRDGATREVVEFKCEARASANFFIETWSNYSLERPTLGWLHHCGADQVWYYFEETRRLFIIDLPKLKAWLDGEAPGTRFPQKRLLSFPERAQAKHAQKNLTVGRLVPIAEAQAAGVVLAVRTVKQAA